MTNELDDAASSVAVEAGTRGETEESGPHVGLFYVVQGELYWEGIPVWPPISLTHAYETLPDEVCSAISTFTQSVDTAISLLFIDEAQKVVDGALVKLDETLKRFNDHPDINKVRETATEFARTKLHLKALSDSPGLHSKDISADEKRIRECRAAFKAVCGR